MMMADNGMVTEWQSYLANLAMVKGGGLEKYWSESEVYRCQGGNQQLARKFVEAIGPARVLTRTIVRSVAVTDKSVRVTLANGKVLEGDHVVLTAPPPVWNRIAIDPALPAGLVPQMGTNVKFLMAVNGPFWRRAELGPEMLTDGPVSATWHAHRWPARRRRGAGRLLGRHRRRHVPRVDADGAHRELSRRAAEGLQGHPSELRARALHGLAVGSLGQGVVLASPRPGR